MWKWLFAAHWLIALLIMFLEVLQEPTWGLTATISMIVLWALTGAPLLFGRCKRLLSDPFPFLTCGVLILVIVYIMKVLSLGNPPVLAFPVVISTVLYAWYLIETRANHGVQGQILPMYRTQQDY